MHLFSRNHRITIFVSLVTIGPIFVTEALAVPPANQAGVIKDLQEQVDDLQFQIDNSHAEGARVSAVDNSAQTLNQTDQPFANPETFISLPVSTTTDGTFVVGFSSLTNPSFCPIGPQGTCDTIQVVQRIFLDGEEIGSGVRSSRVFEPGGGLDQYTTWTASASNIEAGVHTVEVRVSCRIPHTGLTCVGEGYKASSLIFTLWAMHPN